MKVITEKRLIEIKKELDDDRGGEFINCMQSTINSLFHELKEIDTLTVTKPRPMCDKPEVPSNKMSAYVLVYSVGMSVPRISRFDLHNGFDTEARRSGIGWLYLPTYKPELTGDGE